jgi:hypothetical protein
VQFGRSSIQNGLQLSHLEISAFEGVPSASTVYLCSDLMDINVQFQGIQAAPNPFSSILGLCCIDAEIVGSIRFTEDLGASKTNFPPRVLLSAARQSNHLGIDAAESAISLIGSSRHLQRTSKDSHHASTYTVRLAILHSAFNWGLRQSQKFGAVNSYLRPILVLPNQGQDRTFGPGAHSGRRQVAIGCSSCSAN